MFSLKKTIAISLAAAAAAGFAIGAQAATGNGIANGGFESAPAIYTVGSQPGPGLQGAGYWLTQGGSGAATISSDAHSGLYSASVTCPQLCGSTLFGNSSDTGGLTLDPSNWGTAPTFSFWAKGAVGTTGNLTYALRYLDATGNILAQSAPGTNLNSVNASTWSQFSYSGLVIPTGTTAVFFETTFAIGPVGINNPPFTGGGFLIDDLNLSVNVAAIPEPESYAMMMAGLGGLGFLIRRRRPA